MDSSLPGGIGFRALGFRVRRVYGFGGFRVLGGLGSLGFGVQGV